MKNWLTFGATEIGSAHIEATKSNEDSWKTIKNPRGTGIVIADGLGSKQHSKIGSASACNAVKINLTSLFLTKQDALSLPIHIHKTWLDLISPLNPDECASTCLFAFHHHSLRLIQIAALGDGLAASINQDGSITNINRSDSKGFVNETSALKENTELGDWQQDFLKPEEVQSVILLSDGLSEDLQNEKEFLNDLTTGFGNLSTVSAHRRASWMLREWPKKLYSDDKTIAAMLARTE